jgi:hemoglobin
MSEADDAPTPYALLGGDPAIHAVVNRFYDLMDQDPAYAALRRMHAADLAPMRDKLNDWLAGWLGGPQRYHDRPDAACIGSAHAPYAIDVAMRDQWLDCMFRALDGVEASAAAQARIRPPLAAMAEMLRNR